MSSKTRLVQYSWEKLDLLTASFLILTPILTVILTYLHVTIEGWNPVLLIPAFIMYVLVGVAVTAGYHRMFSHRAYKAKTPLKIFFLLFGAAGFASSALKWSTNHRTHHQHADTDKDPHNANEGFFHSHIGWLMFNFPTDEHGKDLTDDKLVMWQDKYFLPIALIVSLAVAIPVGIATGSMIGSFALVFFGRIVVDHQCMFFINSACHYVGTCEYDATQTAKDNAFMALFTFGEGYHNFHHTFQADYRNGIKWYHWDPTKWLIKTMEFMGQAYGLTKMPDTIILKAKMNSQQIRLANKITKTKPSFDFNLDFPNLENLKIKVQKAQLQLNELKKEYKTLKKEKSDQLADFKLKVLAAKKEFKELYHEWLTSLQTAPLNC